METVPIGIGYVLVVIIGLIAAVLLFLMPFFVYKIRNQVVEMNHKMSRMLAVLEKRPDQPVSLNDQVVICEKCGHENKGWATLCVNCKDPL